jgi:calcineurin-like phosphoesterase family protein
MKYFTADTHFGHKFVSQLRGFDYVREHDECLVEAWNNKVNPGDVVYHLGDFMLPQDEEYATMLLRKLNGTKILIRGNHERIQTERARGWAWIGDYKRVTILSPFKVVLFHYALRTWQGMANGDFHLYGHSHGNLASGYGRSMDVGVDTREDFKPYSWDEIWDELKDQPKLVVDHHAIGDERG